MVDRSYVRNLISDLALEPGEDYPCPYLGERGLRARTSGFFTESIPAGYYHALMDLGFRRSGHYFYRPQCSGCAECRQIRIEAVKFRPSRAHRRCLRLNHDLVISVQSPRPSQVKFQLYRQYMVKRHEWDKEKETYESFVNFLYHSPLDTREILYCLGDELIAVGIVDVEPDALSAVYCYYSPEHERRSLGLFNLLWGINYCLQRKIRYYYMGYYVRDCRKMNYKGRLYPSEVLCEDGSWKVVLAG